ncbi:MAG: GNAT family N-acetyltransferase [Bdellovibrionales bacterium]
MTEKPFFFSTKRLWIRPFREEDCAREVELLNDPDVNAALISVPFPFTYADAMDFFRKMVTTYAAGRPEFFVLAESQTDEMIGAIGLHNEHTLDRRPFVAEVGYWLGKPYWGQGYLQEALPVVLAFGFQTLNLKKIVATTNTDNQRSQKLLKKMGFRYLGTAKPLKEEEGATPMVTSWEMTRQEFEDLTK